MDPTIEDVFKLYPGLRGCDSDKRTIIECRLAEAILELTIEKYGDLAFNRRIDWVAVKLHETGCFSLFSDEELAIMKAKEDVLDTCPSFTLVCG